MIRAGGLGWTLVDPTRLTKGPAEGRYRVGERLPMKGDPTISRADVAAFLDKAARDPEVDPPRRRLQTDDIGAGCYARGTVGYSAVRSRNPHHTHHSGDPMHRPPPRPERPRTP